MLGENMKKARNAKGLSQEALSAQLGVVRQTISKWEKGLSIPDADILIKVAEILDTPVETLLESEVDLKDKGAIGQELQFQALKSVLENTGRKNIMGSGLMLLGAFISILGAVYSIALLALAMAHDVTFNMNSGFWSLIQGYHVEAPFIVSVAAIFLGIAIFALGIYRNSKPQ